MLDVVAYTLEFSTMWIISDTISVAKCPLRVHDAFVMHEHFTQWHAFDKRWNVIMCRC